MLTESCYGCSQVSNTVLSGEKNATQQDLLLISLLDILDVIQILNISDVIIT